MPASPASADEVQAQQLLPTVEPIQLIDPAGTVHDDAEHRMPEVERLVEGYRHLVVGRRINDQANALVRQGRLAVYPSSFGQEACEVAAAMALNETDWLFPTYRDAVAVITRGVDPLEVFVQLRGDWHSGYDPHSHNVAPQSTPLATQLIHAAGFAHAAKLRVTTRWCSRSAATGPPARATFTRR